MLVAACETVKHNDVLIFGTNTKVAFDVSSDPTNAGIPSLTLGYKRQEVALVPLMANCPLATCEKECRKYIGVDGAKKDTYSVFASFGGDFNGGSKTGAGLSQFFATGIAAQNLGKSSAAANMVSVQPVDSKTLEQQETINSLQKILGEERIMKIELEQKKIVSDNQAKAAVIVMKVAKADGNIDKVLLVKAIKDSKIKTPWDTNLPKFTTAKKLNNFLEGHVDDEVVNALYEQLK